MNAENASSNSVETHAEQWQLVADGDWLKGQRFLIGNQAILGRDRDCDIVIPGKHLSRRHAELVVHGDHLLVRDLGSSNGTFVNEQSVTEARLYPGDRVRFDVLTFRIVGPRQSNAGNATMIRPAATLSESQHEKSDRADTPVQQKQWKHKPTSLGNRDQTIVMSPARKAANSLWTVLAALLVIATFAGLGWLVLQL